MTRREVLNKVIYTVFKYGLQSCRSIVKRYFGGEPPRSTHIFSYFLSKYMLRAEALTPRSVCKHNMVVSSTALWLEDTDYVTISVDHIKGIAMHYGILFILPLRTSRSSVTDAFRIC